MQLKGALEKAEQELLDGKTRYYIAKDIHAALGKDMSLWS